MTYKNYSILLVLLITLTLIFIGFISYISDPSIFYGANERDNYYAGRLIESNNGLVFQDIKIDMRDVKFDLAKKVKDSDCAVLGSSHALQISSIMNSGKSLVSQCNAIVNLSMPGATIEDFLAISQVLIENPTAPKKIIFTISPLHLGLVSPSKSMWLRYKSYVDKMKNKLSYPVGEENVFFRYFTSLINPEYFMRALDIIRSSDLEIIEAPVFDHSMGLSKSVMLPDGSLVYSNKYVKMKANTPVEKPVELQWNSRGSGKNSDNFLAMGANGINIHASGKYYSKEIVNLFSDLIYFLQSNGFHIYILMTPIHPNFWDVKKSAAISSSIQAEGVIRSLEKSGNIGVLGSYNPTDVGCLGVEFYDSHHLHASCLSKIGADQY